MLGNIPPHYPNFKKLLPAVVLSIPSEEDRRSDYRDRHNAALENPNAREGPILSGLYGASRIVRSDFIGAPDGVLTPAVASILDGLRTLLNADCGRLDCGTLDGYITRLMEKAHVNPDTLEVRWE